MHFPRILKKKKRTLKILFIYSTNPYSSIIYFFRERTYVFYACYLRSSIKWFAHVLVQEHKKKRYMYSICTQSVELKICTHRINIYKCVVISNKVKSSHLEISISSYYTTHYAKKVWNFTWILLNVLNLLNFWDVKLRCEWVSRKTTNGMKIPVKHTLKCFSFHWRNSEGFLWANREGTIFIFLL